MDKGSRLEHPEKLQAPIARWAIGA